MNHSLPEKSEQQSICQSCGICCGGLLFETADIDPSGPGRSWPTELIQSVSDQTLPLPCPAFQDGKCTVYSERPVVCRDYKCKLLSEYSAGETKKNDALAIIHATHSFKAAFFEAVEEVMPIRKGSSLKVIFNRFRDRYKKDFETRKFRIANKKILLTHARLVHQLQTRFHHTDE